MGLVFYVAGPAVAAVTCALLFDKGRRMEALGFRQPFNIWLFWAWLAPTLMVAGTLAITLALSGRGYEAVGGTSIVIALLLTPLVNTPLLLGEELGWRGWLWDRWRGLGFWRNVVATGVVWGLWHAPIVALGHNYPGQPVSGPLLMVLVTLLLAPTFHLVRERGGLERVSFTLLAQVGSREAAQLFVQKRHERVQRRFVAVAPAQERACRLRGSGHASSVRQGNGRRQPDRARSGAKHARSH